MKYLIIVLILALVGCSSPEKDKESDATMKRRGDARQAAFVQCMELSAKIERKADDDVSDIVSECGHQSYYNTNYIQ